MGSFSLEGDKARMGREKRILKEGFEAKSSKQSLPKPPSKVEDNKKHRGRMDPNLVTILGNNKRVV